MKKLDATLFVVDDEWAVRDSLRWMAESVNLPIETYASAQEFLERCPPGRPGCLVLDVKLNGMTGLQLLERLAAERYDIPVIVITGYADVPMAVQALRAGAVDFIEKPYNSSELLDRIRQALDRYTYNRQHQAQRAEAAARLDSLTSREREVLDLLVAGKSSKMIASQLGIKLKTVEAHRANLLAKLGANNVADLVRTAMLVGGSPSRGRFGEPPLNDNPSPSSRPTTS
jgi:FixJ family two-component response regulator